MELLKLSDLAHLRIEPVIAYEGAPPEWARDMEATHPYFTCWFVERGSVQILWGGGRCEIRPGEGVLIPAGLHRRQRIAPETLLVSLSFWAGWEDGRVLLSLPKPIKANENQATGVRDAARTLCGSLRATATTDRRPSEREFAMAQGLKIRAHLDLFVSEIIHSFTSHGLALNLPDKGDPRLNLILADLRKNLRAGALPYPKWQKETGLSKVQMDRVSRRWLGHSLRHHRDAMLFREIQQSLAKGPHSMKELAARLGFFDAAHFCRWVKQRTKKSPSELRNNWS